MAYKPGSESYSDVCLEQLHDRLSDGAQLTERDIEIIKEVIREKHTQMRRNYTEYMVEHVAKRGK